jgi:excinuclease UvrABC nuclease subunit
MTGTKICYEINNFSGLINKSELENDFNNVKHWRIANKEYKIQTKLKGVYLLYDENRNVIYIGKTSVCIRGRLMQHLCSNFNYYLDINYIDLKKEKREKTHYYSYIEVDVKFIEIVEIFLIKEYKPHYNIQYNSH